MEQSGREKRTRIPKNYEVVESMADTNIFKINHAAISAGIHALNGYGGGKQREIGKERDLEFAELDRERAAAKLVRERLEQLPKQSRPLR